MRFPRKRVSVGDFGPSLTVQSTKAEADINVIVTRFGLTGMLPQRLDALDLGAFEGIFDYQTAMNAVVAADRAFLLVPADIRARFANDPQQFSAFCTDPANLDELRRLKLAKPAAPPDPVVVPVPAS
ncbi:internal scaffolding protein [robinz microvirus RP_61]|nr:internal scaffolding protein [robinz microvirus RP_61]